MNSNLLCTLVLSLAPLIERTGIFTDPVHDRTGVLVDQIPERTGILESDGDTAKRTGVLDQDADGDGLSDFREIYKHFTDPDSADSDGDRIPDGHPGERREYAYTIRAVIQVMPPITEEALTDDFQDGRVIAVHDEFVELEIIHYPLSRAAEAIESNAQWQNEYRQREELQQYLSPGMTTNWDRGMRNHMLTELLKRGIDVRRMGDREVVLAVSQWLMRRVSHLNSSAYGIVFVDGKPQVLADHEESFRRIMFDLSGTIEDQFQREVYGRGMYYNEICGSCTSAANYLTTGLKAVGIPTRMVRAIPIVDASNPEQIQLVKDNISDPEIAETILAGLRTLGNSFAAHSYNEVYVGGRWHRLNYTRLGQNTLDQQCMGLMTHVQCYSDLAEAGVGDTWGRWLSRPRQAPFLHSNPYHTIHLSDQPPSLHP